VPERWDTEGRDYRFNHLSNGAQDCPGGPLVFLIGKSVLARVLERYDVTVLEPELDPAGPLPNMLDFYTVRFHAQLREDVA
jgi:cytochrome P450